jgi:hypothetical protein
MGGIMGQFRPLLGPKVPTLSRGQPPKKPRARGQSAVAAPFIWPVRAWIPRNVTHDVIIFNKTLPFFNIKIRDNRGTC